MLVRDVIRATATVGGLSVEALIAQDQHRDVTRLRRVGILVSSRVTPVSWPAMGKLWGGRDHTTLLRAANRALVHLEAGDIDVVYTRDHLLDLIGLEELPVARPANAPRPCRTLLVLNAQIRVAQTRLDHLRAQAAALEEAQS